jgi:hypothetical protein
MLLRTMYERNQINLMVNFKGNSAKRRAWLNRPQKYFTPLWSLITPGDHELNKIDSTLYQEVLM